MNIILLDRKPIFVFGFFISFISVFLFEYAGYILKFPVFYEETSEIFKSLVDDWSKNTDNYRIWRKNQNVKDSSMSLDAFLYGAESNHDSGKKTLGYFRFKCV